MTRTRYHVTHDNGGWRVQREGATRAASVHPAKEAAVQAAREHAINNQPSQVLIHGRSGCFQTERTYRNDPYPPRG